MAGVVSTRLKDRKFWAAGAVSALPMSAGVALATGNSTPLVAAAIAIPIGLLACNFWPDRQSRPGSGGTFLDEMALIGCLQDGLSRNSSSHAVACVAIEIDDFASLKRDWGNAGLADILHQTTSRLFSILRGDDRVARLSESRFMIALPSVRKPELGAVLSVIDRLQASLSAPISIDGTQVHISASAGFCTDAQAPARTGLGLVEATRAALQEALQFAPAGKRGFSPATRAQAGDISRSAQDALQAIKDGQITAWFQPQVSTDTGKVTGFEALARWENPEGGVIQPSEFIPALEDAGRLEDLSDAMVGQALKALKAWDRAGHDVPCVAVNFATQELRNPGLVERIKWDLDRFDMGPERLGVEILETVIASSNDDIVTRNIRAMAEAGFPIELDDFGTGHASLTNIKRFRVGRIKIDRSFVTRVDEDPEQQRMVAAIIALADQLGIETLAEGVETLAEKSLLAQLGCTALQGYAIAKPMPFHETAAWLTRHEEQRRKTIVLPGRTG